MCYKTDFKTRDSDGKTWLTDNGIPVLCFDPVAVRFVGCRLRPDGPEMFGTPPWYGIAAGAFIPFWGGGQGAAFGGQERHVSAFEMTTTEAVASIRLVSRSSLGILETDWRMNISYSAELKSYIYAVKTIATVYRDVDPDHYDPREFEYFDLYPTGLVDPQTLPVVIRQSDNTPVPLPGPRWDYLIYDRENDIYSRGHYSVIKAPLNRFITSAQNNIRLKREGLIGFMNHPVGNPMIQLLDDTASVSRMDLCNWFYDLHLSHDLACGKHPPRQGFSVDVKFKIMSYDFEHSRPLLAQAVAPAYTDAERKAKAFPRLEISGINSFERGVSIDIPDHSKIWRPFRKHPFYTDFGFTDVDACDTADCKCLWDRTVGRTGSASLKIQTTKNLIAGWNLPGFEALHVVLGKHYRLSVHVRTRDLTGRGASLGCYAGPYADLWTAKDETDLKYQFAGKWIQGNAEWEYLALEIVTPAMAPLHSDREYRSQSCNLQAAFWHEGEGESWFDDFEVTPVHEADKPENHFTENSTPSSPRTQRTNK